MSYTGQTQEQIRLSLHAALMRLVEADQDYATEENQRGFGRVDGLLGHALADQDPLGWSPKQTMAAYNILRRYKHTQLPLFGIDFATIDTPEEPIIAEARALLAREIPGESLAQRVARLHHDQAPTSLAASRIQFDAKEGRIVFHFPREDPDFDAKIEAVKAIPGRRWHMYTRTWNIPVTASTITFCTELVVRYMDAPSPFIMDDQATDDLERAMQTIEDRLRSSYAEHTDYNVEGLRDGMVLYPFQRAGVKFIIDNRHVILADDMGLGKTPQSIAAVVDQAAWPALVICPSSLKLNWKREFERWVDPNIGLEVRAAGKYGHALKIQVASGKKSPALMEPIDLLIVNYDIVEAWLPVIKSVRWSAIICDEAHYLKNNKAKRTGAVKDLIKVQQPDYTVLATGTPFLSRPIEGWTLINIIGKQDVFGGWIGYTQRYCDAQPGFGGSLDVSGASNTEELNSILRSSGAMVRRRKADVMKELPSRTWATVPLEMSKAGAKTYVQAEADLVGFVAEKNSKDADRIAEWERMWEDDPTLEDTPRDVYVAAKQREFRASEEARLANSEELLRWEALKQVAYEGKKAAVFDWIDTFLESEEKLVIFANHRATVLELAARYDAPTIMGGQKVEDIEAGKDRFQNDPHCRVLVANIKAGGVGHTLTAASNVAFVELGWTPADMDQALDRTHRIGQDKPVTGWVLVAELPTELGFQYEAEVDDRTEYVNDVTTVDGEVDRLIAKKRRVVESATDGTGVEAQVSVMAELRARLDRRKARK